MLTFDSDSHIYRWDGGIVPSVSEILSPLKKDYSGADPYVLDKARRRGVAVHQITEIIDKGGNPDTDSLRKEHPDIYDDAMKMCEGWENFKKDKSPEFISIEQMVYNPLLKYAGTLDRLTSYGVVDIKCTYGISDVTALQLTAYELCLEPIKRTGLLTAVKLNKNGTYDLYQKDILDDFTYHAIINGLVSVHNWKKSKKRGLIKV